MTARFSLLAGVLCGVALAQTGSITGKVSSTVESTPLGGAKVTLSGANESQAVLTDAGGSFTFAGVPHGNYTLGAEKAGYLAPNGQAGVTVSETSEQPSPVAIRLTPGAMVAGSVTDENGFPYPFASVGLIRRLVTNGRGNLATTNQGSSNDLGEFRISGLVAGSYLVCVSATPSSYQRKHRLSYATTCYPDADPAAAQWVRLAPGDERKLDFHLAPVRGVRVSGSVENLGRGTWVALVRTDPPGFPQLFNPQVDLDEKTSSFEAPAVTPGDYLIAATAGGADGQNRRALRVIHVDREDIRGIRLTLRDGPWLSGTVRMRDDPAPPQNVLGARCDDEACWIFADASGTFRQPIPRPGSYSIVMNPPMGWVVRSMTQGGVDMRDRGISVGEEADPEPLEIVLAKGGGQLEVSFPEAWAKKNAMVQLVLLRRLFAGNGWTAERPALVTGTVGALYLSGIPAGDYRVLAWPAGSDPEYLDPEVLAKYLSSAQAVSIRDSETTRVTVEPVAME